MTNSKIGSALFVLVGSLLLSQLGYSQAPEKKSTDTKKETQPYSSGWMKLKLEYSQKLLEGITKADYDSIVQSAEGMRGLTTVEEFVRGRMPGYAIQLEIFKEANSDLIAQAKNENIDGAALAFTQLTLSCVNCHKRLRESEAATKSQKKR